KDAGSALDARNDGSLSNDASPVGCDCHPYWCGCGTCQPEAIVCTRVQRLCAVGCISAPCTQLDAATCACHQGRCVRGGIDAAIGCYLDEECPSPQCCDKPDGSTDSTLGTCGACL